MAIITMRSHLLWHCRASLALAMTAFVTLDGCGEAQAQVYDTLPLAMLVQEAISSSDLRTRLAAAEKIAYAVGPLGQRELDSLPDQLIDDVASLLDDDTDLTKVFAARALRSIGVRAKRALPALERALERTPDSRLIGVHPLKGALHNIRSAIFSIQPKSVTPYLMKLVADVMGSSDSIAQQLAVQDIMVTVLMLPQSEIDTLSDHVIDDIADLLEDPRFQSQAATALRFMGSRARRALPALEQALRRNRASNVPPASGDFDAVGQAILGIMGGEPHVSPALRRN